MSRSERSEQPLVLIRHWPVRHVTSCLALPSRSVPVVDTLARTVYTLRYMYGDCQPERVGSVAGINNCRLKGAGGRESWISSCVECVGEY